MLSNYESFWAEELRVVRIDIRRFCVVDPFIQDPYGNARSVFLTHFE